MSDEMKNKITPEVKAEVARQLEIIKRGSVDFISEEEMVKKLTKSIVTNTPLKIKQGFDPTAPDLHLGHTVSIRKLRQFQDLGHEVMFLIGDYTAMVGDPTGKNSTRKRLTKDEVLANAETYKQQVYKILDPEKTKIHFNSKWFDGFGFSDVLNLTANMTVAQMLERDDFTKRYASGTPISIIEFLYPLMQGYDSVAMKSDVELGGTDQKFNLLVGRALQKVDGQEPQCVITMPIIEGLDGVQKMSKSLNNYIGIDDSPRDMFGKTMKIPDTLIEKYFTLLTDVPTEEIEAMKVKIENGENPRNVKVVLAKAIVEEYYDKETADASEVEFNNIFKKGGIPDDIATIDVGVPEIDIKDLMIFVKAVTSKGEAKRLIKQNAVSISDNKITDIDALITVENDMILKVGKKKFYKIVNG